MRLNHRDQGILTAQGTKKDPDQAESVGVCQERVTLPKYVVSSMLDLG